MTAQRSPEASAYPDPNAPLAGPAMRWQDEHHLRQRADLPGELVERVADMIGDLKRGKPAKMPTDQPGLFLLQLRCMPARLGGTAVVGGGSGADHL